MHTELNYNTVLQHEWPGARQSCTLSPPPPPTSTSQQQAAVHPPHLTATLPICEPVHPPPPATLLQVSPLAIEVSVSLSVHHDAVRGVRWLGTSPRLVSFTSEKSSGPQGAGYYNGLMLTDVRSRRRCGGEGGLRWPPRQVEGRGGAGGGRGHTDDHRSTSLLTCLVISAVCYCLACCHPGTLAPQHPRTRRFACPCLLVLMLLPLLLPAPPY